MQNTHLRYLPILSLFAFNCLLIEPKKVEPVTVMINSTDYTQRVEFITDNVVVFDTSMITALHADHLDVQQWKNHIVVSKNPDSACKLCDLIKAGYPEVITKLYDTIIYQFSRTNCIGIDTTFVKSKDIILTANLVADTNLQKEYMEYHRTQFEKWPDVAKGFCNAGFQKLLVLKNGRQLMLIISIPENKTLDELNPKTTENNPKMVEWNSLMKKYQEGIPGTKPGEVWVFLKPI